MTVLIPVKIGFRKRNSSRNKTRYFIIAKLSIHQAHILTILITSFKSWETKTNRTTERIQTITFT
jgi:hypothetical protein